MFDSVHAAPEDSPITVTCEYTIADLREAVKRRQRRALAGFWPFWLIYFVVLACVIAKLYVFPGRFFAYRGAPPVSTADTVFPVLPWVGAIVVVILAARWARLRIYSRQFSRFGPLQRPRTFHFSPDGVTITEPFSTHEYQWQAFPRWEETKNLFTIFTSEFAMEIVTKRTIQSEPEIERLRNMLKSSIDAASNARQAFPVLPLDTIKQ